MRWGGGESARTDGGSWEKKKHNKRTSSGQQHFSPDLIWLAFLFFLRFEKFPADRKESTCWMSTLTRTLLFHQKFQFLSIHQPSSYLLSVFLLRNLCDGFWVEAVRCDAIGPRTKVIHDKQSCSMLSAWMLFFEYHFHGRSRWSLQVCVACFYAFVFPALHLPQRKALSVSLCWRISVVDSTQSPTFVVLFGGRAMRFNAKVKCCYNNKFLSLSPRARCGWEMEVYFSTIGRIASMFVHVSSSWSSVFLRSLAEHQSAPNYWKVFHFDDDNDDVVDEDEGDENGSDDDNFRAQRLNEKRMKAYTWKKNKEQTNKFKLETFVKVKTHNTAQKQTHNRRHIEEENEMVKNIYNMRRKMVMANGWEKNRRKRSHRDNSNGMHHASAVQREERRQQSTS